MDDKIDATLAYYYLKRNKILNFINTNDCLVADQIIEKGEELAVLEYKITALQIAKEN